MKPLGSISPLTVRITPPAGTKAAVSKVTFVNTLGTAPFSSTLPFTYAVSPTIAKLEAVIDPKTGRSLYR